MDGRADGVPLELDGVLLDAGGVLLDLDYAYLRRLVEPRVPTIDEKTLARAEAIARRDVDRLVEQGHGDNRWREYFHLILGRAGVPGADHDGIIDALWEAHERVGLWTVAVAGAIPVVRELKRRGLRVGVVSNAEGQVARDLDRAGFGGMFEAVVDSAIVGVSKPDPEIFRIALEQTRLAAERVLFVGDVPKVDVDGARAAGIAAVLLDRHDLYPAFELPRLRSIEGLPRLLDQNSAA